MRSCKLLLITLIALFYRVFAIPKGWKFKHQANQNTQMFHHFEPCIINSIDGSMIHQAVIAIQSKEDIQKLFDLVDQVSDPSSDIYGQHVMHHEIGTLLNYHEAAERVSAYLHTRGFVIEKTTRISDFITVSANVSTWESLLQTKFHHYTRPQGLHFPPLQVLRASYYCLPEAIFDDIHAIFQITDFPVIAVNTLKRSPLAVSTIAGYVTPAFLNAHYSIMNNTGEHQTTQATYQSGNYLNPNDLTAFQDYFGIPRQSIDVEYGSGVVANACTVSNTDNCTEASLDTQYMTAIAQNIENVLFEWPTSSDPWLDWLLYVASLEKIPNVISISYASYESAFTSSYLSSFQIQAASLAAMGVTLLSASGDDGVGGFIVPTYGRTSCAYYAMFPASCPYILAVGGTQGPEVNNGVEVACSVLTGSIITTGGGFSTHYTKPSYQSAEVTSFLSRTTALSGYSMSGRGYPDISALANDYLVAVANELLVVSGTSASCPVVAAMISLVNEARIKAGGSVMGWINPFLYQYSSNFTTDIASGNNKCTSGASSATYICCNQGFSSISGWDAVTGLGVLNFTLFKNAALKLVSKSAAPTRAPTFTVSSMPPVSLLAPSTAPSLTLSASPSATGEPSLSAAPSFKSSSTDLPSQAPSQKLSVSPSVAPTTTSSIAIVGALSITFAVTQHILEVSTIVNVTSLSLRSLLANVTCDGMELLKQYCLCSDSCLSIAAVSSSRRRLTASSAAGTLSATVAVEIPLSGGGNYEAYRSDPSSLYSLLTSTLTSQFADNATAYSTSVLSQLKSFDNTSFGHASLSSAIVFTTYAAVYSPTVFPTLAPAISSGGGSGSGSFTGSTLIAIVVAAGAVCLIIIVSIIWWCLRSNLYSTVERRRKDRYGVDAFNAEERPSQVPTSEVELFGVNRREDQVLNV